VFACKVPSLATTDDAASVGLFVERAQLASPRCALAVAKGHWCSERTAIVAGRLMDNDRRMEGCPSRIAMMAAVVRGRHRLEDSPPWILDDPIALEFVGSSWRDIAASGDSRYSTELGRQIRAAIATRSRYAEHRLELGDFRQYVLLGAGLDSFRWRRPDLLGPLRLFEVDHPISQAWKRKRMGELGLHASEYQVFAPVDFEVESLDDGLDASDFDWEQPTIFSWLGVIPYLTINAVETTLRTITRCRSGSEVVFEYGLTEPFLDDLGREFVAGFAPVATKVGEPLKTGVRWSPVEAEEVVTRCGLRVADHPSREDLVGRYFSGRTDGLQPWGVSRLMAATVP
jgi:methyltransferase (TIGR00027 family)